jgi:hypothetical protein
MSPRSCSQSPTVIRSLCFGTVRGKRADALKITQQFKMIHAGLGDKDETFRLLEKAYEQRSASIHYLAVEPALYGMRSDPRYADLLRRIGLPQPAD